MSEAKKISDVLRIAVAQFNPVVGDVAGKLAKARAARADAAGQGADLLLLTELFISGYPPEDLVLKPGFLADNMRALNSVVEATGNCMAVIGFVDSVAVQVEVLPSKSVTVKVTVFDPMLTHVNVFGETVMVDITQLSVEPLSI